jgi:hypothetical protein
MRFRLRAVCAAVATGTVIAASVAACGPQPGGAASPASSAPAGGTTASDTSADSLPFGSVGGGFVPLAGGPVASVQVGAGQTVTVPVAGQGGVPASGASAALLAVAVTGAAASGSVTVYPAGGTQPSAPSLSWAGRDAAAGLAVSALSSAGAVAVVNSSARPVTATLGADGYWLAGDPAVAGAFGPLGGGQVARVRVGPGQAVTVPVAGQAGVPASAAAGAVVLAVEASDGWAPGQLTVSPAGPQAIEPNAPGFSSPAQISPAGLVVTALGRGGAVTVRNSSAAAVTVTVDADGYWLSGIPAAAGTFGSLWGGGVARVQVGPGHTVTVPVAGQAGVPASGAGAVALTAQTMPGQAAGSVTVSAGGAGQPAVPSLSWAAHHGASGLVVSQLGSGGTVAVHNSSAYPATVILAAAGYWLSGGRVVSDITAKPTTVTLTGSDITAVAGDPAGTQTVTLAAGVPVPPVGRVLVAPISATTPAGLLGTVTAVSGGADGTSVVTLSPATLDQAYSTFDVSTSQAVTESDVVQASGNAAGQAQTTSATQLPATATVAAARDLADQASDPGYDLSNTAFSCDGSGAGPTMSLSADLSKMSVDLSLDANPEAPDIHFLITADPVFDINFGFTGTVTCKLSAARFLEIQIPIPATPGLVVDIYPVVTLSAGGQASIQFQWAPRAAVGFDKAPGIDSEVHAFGSSGSVGINATAGADLFLGFEADLTLAGRVGVGGDLGPDLSATYDAGTGCVTVDGALKADLSASANVFVKSWTFALATGTFAARQLYSKCGGSASTSPSPSSTASSSPPSPAPSSSTPGSYDWTATAVSPPGNLGTPDILDVSCWAPSDCVATGISDDSSGNIYGELLTDSGGSWTAIQAPLPANAAGLDLVYRFEVSCPAAFQCVAAGNYTDTSGALQGFLLTDSGGSWTAQEAPLPIASANPKVSMGGLSCWAAEQCIVTGTYFPDQSGGYGVMWTDSGGTWQVANSDAGGEVSCWAPSQCMIAGDGFTTDLDGSLTNVDIPQPSPSDYLIVTGVSCQSATQCIAVGVYKDPAGNLAGLVWTDSGGTWTVAQEPEPAGVSAAGPDVILSGVSCWAASQCLAVGMYGDNSSGDLSPMLLTDSDGSWTTTAVPQPSNDASAIQALQAVSCPAPAQCVAAGDDGDIAILTGNQ